MTPVQLSALIRSAAEDAVAAGELELTLPDSVPVTRPPHGPAHWASTVALLTGSDDRGRSSREIAGVVARRLRRHEGIASAEVSGPGFLNITVDVAELGQVVVAILAQGLDSHTIVHDHGGTFVRDDARSCESDAELVADVQFAHARLRSLAVQAADHGVVRSVFRPEMLTHETEVALLLALAEAEDVGRAGDPRRFLHHLGLVAETFQACFAATRLTPRGLDPVTDLHRTRLGLMEATRVVLSSGLRRLGLTAPEHI